MKPCASEILCCSSENFGSGDSFDFNKSVSNLSYRREWTFLQIALDFKLQVCLSYDVRGAMVSGLQFVIF
jgi:hypothetical protein